MAVAARAIEIRPAKAPALECPQLKAAAQQVNTAVQVSAWTARIRRLTKSHGEGEFAMVN